MKRRDVLKSMGALAGMAGASRLMSGCGDNLGGGGPGEIKHIVLLMMENRSYDHLLGARSMLEGKPGNGLTATMTNPDADGNPVALWKAGVTTMCVPDPAHGWDAVHVQLNEGANDGFVTTHQSSHPGDIAPMQYLTREHMPVTWALSDEYATCDAWFASVLGATWPNRFFWMSGTSMGMRSNDLPEGGFTTPTIFHRLEEAGVDWKLYFADLPFVALLGAGFDLDVTERLWRIEDFFADCAAGTLPSVVYLDPPFGNADDHPPHHPILGQQYLASVYAALAASPQWKDTLLVVTYDEHGGFFDHVVPPACQDERAADGFGQLGFRVPTLVVGPYVKRGHVSSVVRDHTSALRHLELTHQLEPLTVRSSAANDLGELIDQDRLARGEASAPIELPVVEVDDWVIDEACAAAIGNVAHDILRIADQHPEWVARWDRRKELPQISRAIAAELARHGRGGIRRR